MAKEIPGFYFDEEKGKYFRIQQSHRVIPGTGYTKQSIKAAELVKQERKRMQQQVRRQAIGKIIRSQLLLNTTSPLSARLGASTSQNREDIVRQYGNGLTACGLYNQSRSQREWSGFIGSSFSIERSGILRAAYRYDTGEHFLLKTNITHEATGLRDSLPRDLTGDHDDMLRVADLVTCVYGSNGEVCAVATSDGSPEVSLKPVRSHNSDYWLSLNLTAQNVETTWDVAASPNVPTLAVATDFGLLIIHCQDLGVITTIGSGGLPRKEQMNVSFKDPYIAMSGERSGRVNFTDTRVSQSVVRLLHSSAVLGTVALRDGNHVIAHGYSTTSTYDLRWIQETPVAPKARSADSSQHSMACLQFAVPANRSSDHYTRGRKIAYSSDLDLIVAASSNTLQQRVAGFVTLYSASTGKVVNSPLGQRVFTDDVRSVDIRRLGDERESIFCLSEHRLDQWTFGRLHADEAEFYGLATTSG